MDRKGKEIITASWVSIAGNSVLAIMKLVVGFVAGSFAVIADGIDSASDIVGAIVTLIAARVIAKPPNAKFAYGYVKADTLASKILSMFIFLAGAQLAIATIGKIISGTPTPVPRMLAIYFMAVSVIGKVALNLYLNRVGSRYRSNMLITLGKNMRNDIVISVGVIVGLVLAQVLNSSIIDKIIALLISAFIMVEAIRIFMKTNTELMDGINDPELYERLFQAIQKVEGAYNPHRTRARKIGSKYMINLDVEVDPTLSVKEAHHIAQNVERMIKKEIEHVYDVMVHIEPYGNEEQGEKFGLAASDFTFNEKSS